MPTTKNTYAINMRKFNYL